MKQHSFKQPVFNTNTRPKASAFTQPEYSQVSAKPLLKASTNIPVKPSPDTAPSFILGYN